MALVVHNHGANASASRITSALDNFRKLLSEEERKRFNEIQVAQPSKPDENSVMILIAEIDQKNSQKLSRYVGAKLQPFLDSVQQFTGVVDTLVQGGPDVGNLIWGSIKLSLLILSKYSEYFAKLSALFQRMGRTCPRLHEIGYLFESSESLKQSLCQYFAGVIEICTKALKISRRPGIVQFSLAAFTPYEREFGEAEKELSQLADDIEKETSLASNRVQIQESKLNDLERSQNTLFRKSVSKFSEKAARDLSDLRESIARAEKRRLERDRKAVMDSLCVLDHNQAWKQARNQCIAGTAEWFKKNCDFVDWVNREDSSNLLYFEKMGSGKTVLTANIISHIAQCKQVSDDLCYFFCQPEVPESLEARNVLGSLARQLLHNWLDQITAESIHRLLRDTWNMQTEDMATFIVTHFEPRRACFIVLDGLDKCETQDVAAILIALGQLYSAYRSSYLIKVFISANVEFKQRLTNIPGPTKVLTSSNDELNDDISAYIEATLDQKLEGGQLKLQDPELIVTIQHVLLIGVKGMYLWAYLLIEDLCTRHTDEDILLALEGIPQRLSDLFCRLLDHALSNEKDTSISLQILKWTVAALRPLNLLEFEEALSIRPGQQSLNSQLIPNDLLGLIAKFRGLLTFDEDDKTIRLVHHSFKQFLLTEYIPQQDSTTLPLMVKLNEEVAWLCMTYLKFGDFDQTVARVPAKSSPITPVGIISATGVNLMTLSKVSKARALLGRPREKISTMSDDFVHAAIRRQLEDASTLMKNGSNSTRGKLRFPFLTYAQSSWFFHSKQLEKMPSPSPWTLFETMCTLYDEERDLGSKPFEKFPWNREEWCRLDDRLVRWVCQQDHSALLQCIVKIWLSRPFGMDMLKNLLRGILHHEKTGLLDTILPLLHLHSHMLEELIQQATNEACLSYIVMILQGLKRNESDAPHIKIAPKVYSLARQHSYRPIIEAIADNDLVQMDSESMYWPADATHSHDLPDFVGTALHAAVYYTDHRMTEILLRKGFDVNNEDGKWGIRSRQTPLDIAIMSSCVETVVQLLEAGADPNKAQPDATTPLAFAIKQGNALIVKELIKAGGDPNLPIRPLLPAALNYRPLKTLRTDLPEQEKEISSIRTALVRELIRGGALVNAQTFTGRTALHFAAGSGHIDIIDDLLAAGADLNAITDESLTALHYAVFSNHFSCTQRLLAAGADFQSSDKYGRTPLHHAIQHECWKIFDALLAIGAEANVRDENGSTPLILAVERDAVGVIEALLGCGANPNFKDKYGQTALTRAVFFEQPEICRLLCAAGADVNSQDKRGETALMRAVQVGSPEVVRVLLELGADSTHLNQDGESAVVIAKSRLLLSKTYTIQPDYIRIVRQLENQTIMSRGDRGAE